MSHPEKRSQNEKLQALRETAIHELNLIVDENMELQDADGRLEAFVLSQNALIDELTSLIEPEEPE